MKDTLKMGLIQSLASLIQDGPILDCTWKVLSDYYVIIRQWIVSVHAYYHCSV